MRAVVIIDFEAFSDDLKHRIARFREKLPSNVPVIWTITMDAPDIELPRAEHGFYEGRDRIFIKPDIDASFDTAVDQNGVALMDYLPTSGITTAYTGGSTYYGCVLGGANSMKSLGITPILMRDLTDFHELDEEDHDEAREHFTKSNHKVIDSSEALASLLPPSPRDPAP